MGLGSVTIASLKEARDKAFELRRDIRLGIDPIAERKKREIGVPTFAKAAKTVHMEQKAGWKNGKHLSQ